MACERIEIGGRVAGIVCGPAPARRRCDVCKSAWGVRLCDWPTMTKTKRGKHGKARTCDRNLCAGCGTSVGVELDLCPEHHILYRTQRAGPALACGCDGAG